LNETAPQRIVLAYSGGLDTTVAIRWLIEQYQAEVVAVTLDIGQGGELADIRERALAAGAVRAHVIDAREQLVRDYILPTLQAGVLGARCVRAGVEEAALREGRAVLAGALGHALIARRLVDVARMEGASAIAHGEVAHAEVAHAEVAPPKAAGTFPEKVAGTFCAKVAPGRIGASIHALDPALTVIVPECIWQMSPADKVAYARASGIAAPAYPENPYRTDANLWGRSVTSALPVDLPDDIYTLTRAPNDCPDEPAYLEIEFDAGVPVRANGIEMPMLELVESLEIIAGAHGVGRIGAGHGLSGAPREVHEAPAAVVLHTAHAALEKLVMTPDLQRLKHQLAGEYADLVQSGSWYSDTRTAIDAFVRTIQPHVTGTVRLTLIKGECRHDGSQVTSRPGERFHHAAAEGLVS
jgi:argininosuccinate synthase